MTKFLIFLCYLNFFGMVSAKDYSLQNLEDIHNLSDHLLISESNDFSAENFKENNKQNVTFNYTKKSLWFKFSITPSALLNEDVFVFFTSNVIGKLTLFKENQGSLEKLETIDVNDRIGLFPKFKLPQLETTKNIFYVKREGIHQLDTKVLLSNKKNLDSLERRHEGLYIFYIAVWSSLLVYNLFLYLFTRDKDFLFYCGFLFFLGATISTISGFLERYILTVSINQYLGFNSSMTLIFTHLFAFHFLSINTLHSCFKKIMAISIAMSLFCAFFNLFTPLYAKYPFFFGSLIDFNIIISVLFLFFMATYLAVKKKSSLAKIYIISWLFMYTGIIIWFGVYFQIIPATFYGANAILVGNIFEMLVLAIGLAFKINLLQSENQRVKHEAQDKEKYAKLLRVLSHDIANSLFVILNYAKRYQKRGGLNNFDHDKAWSRIHKSSQHIEKILQSVKQEQVLEKDKKGLELSKHNPSSCLRDIIDLLEERAQEKNIMLNYTVQNESSEILTDKSILTHQIFGNILSNAIKYSYPNSDINIELKTQDNIVFISFEDFGIGMDEVHLARIKEKKNLISTIGTEGEKGSGFGLNLVCSYLELLEGEINIESKINSGTKIIITFKIAA